MTERTFPARDEALNDVLAYAEEELEKPGCPMKVVMSVTVALEEVFVNVAHYAYPETSGEVSMAIDCDSESRTMTFRMTDSEVPKAPIPRRQQSCFLVRKVIQDRRRR